MKEEVLPGSPLEEDSVHFKAKRSTCLGLEAFFLTLTLLPLWLFISGRVGGLDGAFWGFILALFSTRTVLDAFHLLRERGFGGLSLDSEGIEDRTMLPNLGRVYWHEIKAVFPSGTSSLGFFGGRLGITLDVKASYSRRRSAWWKFFLLRRSGHLQLKSHLLKGSRDEILQVLQDGLRNHELRSISDAKQLEDGSEGGTSEL